MDEMRWLVSLTVPPALEESVVDWLLNLESGFGFTSFPVSGHSSHSRDLTLAEQVSGRKRQVRFEIYLTGSSVEPLIRQLRQDFSGTGIYYWTTPVGQYGQA